MDAVTISANQSDIATIGFPVLYSSAPRVLVFWCSYFLCAINMVNVENTMIRNTANGTLAAKFDDEFHFPFPKQSLPLGIPECFFAFRRAESSFAFAFAVSASTESVPAVQHVTRDRAKQTIPLLDLICSGFKRGCASYALSCDSCFWSSRRSAETFVPRSADSMLGAFVGAKYFSSSSFECLRAVRTCMNHGVYFIRLQTPMQCYFEIAKRRCEEALAVGTLFDPATFADPDLFAEV